MQAHNPKRNGEKLPNRSCSFGPRIPHSECPVPSSRYLLSAKKTEVDKGTFRHLHPRGVDFVNRRQILYSNATTEDNSRIEETHLMAFS